MPHLRLTTLKFVFVQTLPDYSGSHPVQISYANAVRRIRELHYDRGTIVNAMETEAKNMAECNQRYDSFNKSTHLREKVILYQLAQLGFFFVGDDNSPGKLRCSFCRRTIHMFSTNDIQHSVARAAGQFDCRPARRGANASRACDASHSLPRIHRGYGPARRGCSLRIVPPVHPPAHPVSPCWSAPSPPPAATHRSGACWMRQRVSPREHFRRGNAVSTFIVAGQGRSRWGNRCSNGVAGCFKRVTGVTPPLMPQPLGNRRHEVRPISYPGDQYLCIARHTLPTPCAKPPAPAAGDDCSIAQRGSSSSESFRWPKSSRHVGDDKYSVTSSRWPQCHKF